MSGQGCDQCRSFAVTGMREMAAVILDGHHPDCPTGLGRKLEEAVLCDYTLVSDLVDRVVTLTGERDEARDVLRQCWDAAGLLCEEWTGKPDGGPRRRKEDAEMGQVRWSKKDRENARRRGEGLFAFGLENHRDRFEMFGPVTETTADFLLAFMARLLARREGLNEAFEGAKIDMMEAGELRRQGQGKGGD